MALAELNFFSYYLGMNTSVMALLPEERGMPISDDSHKKYPVLYLLHGHGDDQTGWIRKSMLELKVRDRELIVVMPTAHRGFYINGKHGYRYFDYLAKELPRAVANFFHGSLERKDNYIAGLSMGGYGALYLALSCPEQYAGAAALSAAVSPAAVLDVGSQMFSVPDFRENIADCFGCPEQADGSEYDLRQKCLDLKKRDAADWPKIMQSIGTEDPLYPANLEFSRWLKQEMPGLEYQYTQAAGNHDWIFWDSQIDPVLRFFGL